MVTRYINENVLHKQPKSKTINMTGYTLGSCYI